MDSTTTTTTTTTTTNGVLGQASALKAFVIGAIVGVVGWLLTLFFRSVVVENLFCRSTDTFSVCSNGGTIAWVAGMVIVLLASVFMLTQANIYRPLLVVIAVAVALWGVGSWFLPMTWWAGLLWQGVVFGLAYAAFSWLAAHERFIISLVAVIVVVVVARIVVGL